LHALAHELTALGLNQPDVASIAVEAKATWTRPRRRRSTHSARPPAPLSRLRGLLGEIQQRLDRRPPHERQMVQVERDGMAFGERGRDGGLYLGDALLVDAAIDDQMRSPQCGAATDLESRPRWGDGVHADNNARSTQTLRQIDTASSGELLRASTETD
jgi:hypothetical protein